MRMTLLPLLVACVACSGDPDATTRDGGTATPDGGISQCPTLAREFDVPKDYTLTHVTTAGDTLYFSVRDDHYSRGVSSRVYSMPTAGGAPEKLLVAVPEAPGSEQESVSIYSFAVDGATIWTIEDRDDETTVRGYTPGAETVVLRAAEPWFIYLDAGLYVRPNEVVVLMGSGESSAWLALAKDGSGQRVVVTPEETDARGRAEVHGDEVWFFGNNGVSRRPLVGGDFVDVVTGEYCTQFVLGDTHFGCRSGDGAAVYPRAGGEPSTRVVSRSHDLRGMALDEDVLWAVATDTNELVSASDDINILIRSDAANASEVVCGPVGRSVVVTPSAIVSWSDGESTLYFADR